MYFFIFWWKSKTPKRHFEINCPLGIYKKDYWTRKQSETVRVLKSYWFPQDSCKYFGIKMIKIWKMFKAFPRTTSRSKIKMRLLKDIGPHFRETKKRTLARYNSYFQIAFLIECEKSCFLGGCFKDLHFQATEHCTHWIRFSSKILFLLF